MEDSVKFVRLNSGEDLISVITEVQQSGEDPYYILSNPMKVMYTMPAKPGYYAISLMQWVSNKLCEDQTFTLNPMDITTIGRPTDKMISYYWQSIDHFSGKEVENESSEDILDEEPMSDSDGMELLQELMSNLKVRGKGTLH
jgi:hypothetical protein